MADPLSDLKQGVDDLRRNRTLKYILAMVLQVGNFLNGVMVSEQGLFIYIYALSKENGCDKSPASVKCTYNIISGATKKIARHIVLLL